MGSGYSVRRGTAALADFTRGFRAGDKCPRPNCGGVVGHIEKITHPRNSSVRDGVDYGDLYAECPSCLWNTRVSTWKDDMSLPVGAKSFKKGVWNEAPDKSAMKVTNNGSVLKTETITDKKYPHEHRGTNVDRETGKIEEFYVGKYADPGGKGRRPIE